MLKLSIFDRSGNYITGGLYPDQPAINKTLSNLKNIEKWGGAGNFTHTIEDVTEKLTTQQKVNISMDAINHGQKCMAFIRYINKQKLASGFITNEMWQQILSNQTLAQIERMLWAGSFGTAKALIATLNNDFYTSQEKQDLVNLINEFVE